MYLDVWSYINIIFFPLFSRLHFCKISVCYIILQKDSSPFLANMCVSSIVDKQHGLYCDYQKIYTTLFLDLLT